MKKILLLLILLSTASTAFATTPKLAHVGFGEIVAGTVVGIFAADALKNIFTPRPTAVYYVQPSYPVHPAYVFNPYTQCYEACYY